MLICNMSAADFSRVVRRAVATMGTPSKDGLIWRVTEYWPDPFEPAAWRARWVERMEQA